MTALLVGAETSSRDTTAKTRVAADQPVSGAPEVFVKWIPAEVITFYAAILGLGAAQGPLTGNETPAEVLERIEPSSFAWFATSAAIGIALLVAGALRSDRSGRPVSWGSVTLRATLMLVSFVIWTSALPGAWTYGWTLVRDMGPAYTLLLVPVAGLFSAVAEAVTRRASL